MSWSRRLFARSVLDVFLKGHIWLGICAVTCTYSTYLLLQQQVQIKYLLFVFFGTMTIYNLHTSVSKYLEKKYNRGESLSQPIYLKILIPTGLLLTLGLYIGLTLQNKLLLLAPIFLAIIYVIPFYNGRRLKDYPFLKIATLTVVWTIITLVIPLWKVPHWWSDGEYSYLMANRIFFIFALAIPFDIRDVYSDQLHHLKTLPSVLGPQNSRILAIVLLALAAILMTLGMKTLLPGGYNPILLWFPYLMMGIMILAFRRSRSSIYYMLFLDGILFIYGMTILFSIR